MGTLLGAAGSLAVLAVGVVVLSAVAVLILSAVGTVLVMLMAGLWMLMLPLAISEVGYLPLLFVVLVLIGLVCRRLRRS